MNEPQIPPIRLGVNVDHVATLRNARGGTNPDLIRAAKAAIEAGADNITAHLREDRRHIRDEDVTKLMTLETPLNLEMAVTEEMLGIALAQLPHSCCLVPERRQELTTEGGLSVAGQVGTLRPFIAKLRKAGIKVSLFIDPEPEQIEASKVVESDAVELHTGPYCAGASAGGRALLRELERLENGARLAAALGLEVHAGHGLDLDNVGAVARIPEIVELNIGHFLVGEAVFIGLGQSVRLMRDAMDGARADAERQATGAGAA